MSFIDRLKVLDKSGTNINPATDESISFLRRILKLVESLGNVDIANRQRVTVDSITAGTTLPTVTTITSVTNVAGLYGLDQRALMDTSRINYNTGIRSQLKWS